MNLRAVLSLPCAALLVMLVCGCGGGASDAGQEAGPGAAGRTPPQAMPGATRPDEGENAMLSEQARARLLEVARQAVEAAVRKLSPPTDQVDAPELQGHQGAFVTLKTHGRLRGCIGRFVSDQPLWKTVREMAVASATEDGRFVGMRLRPDELPDLHLEVSVLSLLERTDDPMSIELGVHGIYIRRGMATGCFLPQVATETGWSKEEFLSNCCAGKAGLSPDAWKDPRTEVYVFTAQVVEETGGERE